MPKPNNYFSVYYTPPWVVWDSHGLPSHSLGLPVQSQSSPSPLPGSPRGVHWESHTSQFVISSSPSLIGAKPEFTFWDLLIKVYLKYQSSIHFNFLFKG